MSHSFPKLRRGAVLPMFGFLLPVIFILCGLAINLAYLRLTKTEVKISTDCAAHAAGRAMSIHQTTDDAITEGKRIAALNTVSGQPLTLADDQFVFGTTTRLDNGYGRYEFHATTKEAVDLGTERATSIRVFGSMELPLLVQAIPNVDTVDTYLYSTATQVDRDIALVLDRSGSMLYYEDDDALTDTLYDLYNSYEWVYTPGYWAYHWYWGWYWVPSSNNYQRKISWSEYEDATEYLYDRDYSQNVIDQLYAENTAMGEFADDWENSSGAPRHSRWALLAEGVDAFLDVLDTTDQEERVSLTTFSSTTSLDLTLRDNFNDIRTKVATISPYGGTAIGDGMTTGHPTIFNHSNARQFASKTIVVLTDGIYNTGGHPETAATTIVAANNVTIHTVTFTPGADQSMMKTVAEIGSGRHYHADDGAELIAIFEEIANNLPTILTE